MFHRNQIASAVAAVLLALACSSSARAQYDVPLTPFQGFGNMVQQNLDFEARFYPWAWQGSMEAARQTRGQQLPFNAMTIHNANNQANHAFSGYLNNLQYNSNAQMNAVGNWTNQAIRGYSPYVNGNGQGYMLPYGPEAYYESRGGYVHPGQNWNYPSTNYYPR